MPWGGFGGSCDGMFGVSCSYPTDGVLQGDVRFHGLTKPIVRVELAIVRVETGGVLPPLGLCFLTPHDRTARPQRTARLRQYPFMKF